MVEQRSAQARLDMGRLLIIQRATFPRRGKKHDGWTAYVRGLGIDDSTAYRYMKLAEYVDGGGNRPEARSSHEVIAGVYFVRGADGGPIKVGESSDILARLRAHQSSSPVLLRLTGIVPVSGGQKERRALEQTIHRALKKHRLHGEWFAAVDAVFQVLNELTGGE